MRLYHFSTGRRVMFYISSGIHTVFNAFMLLTPSYGIIMALRFFSGLAFQTDFQMPYIIGRSNSQTG